MRERVAMLGGTLHTEATSDGGFLVVAALPVAPDLLGTGGATAAAV